MGIGGFEAKDVARQVKGPDLSAAIGENFIGAHRTRYDLVHVVCRFVVAKDLRVAAVGYCGAHQVYRIAERAVSYLRPSWRIVCGSTDETSADCVRRQHGPDLSKNVMNPYYELRRTSKIQISSISKIPEVGIGDSFSNSLMFSIAQRCLRSGENQWLTQPERSLEYHLVIIV